MARRLTDVARYAGVSEATVSRVLNQRPGVAKATQELVLTALDVLGYERPTGLRGARARLVGLVHSHLSRDFGSGLCRDAARAPGLWRDLLGRPICPGVRQPRALSAASRAWPAGRAGERRLRGSRVSAHLDR